MNKWVRLITRWKFVELHEQQDGEKWVNTPNCYLELTGLRQATGQFKYKQPTRA